MISGLMKICSWSRVSLVSTTTMRSCMSTCVAARPTPLASYMVSPMSAAIWRMRSSTVVTGFAILCRRGSGNFKIDKIVIIFYSGYAFGLSCHIKSQPDRRHEHTLYSTFYHSPAHQRGHLSVESCTRMGTNRRFAARCVCLFVRLKHLAEPA